MQAPDMTTPVSKCHDLGAYSVQMCSKFPKNATLTGVATQLSAATQTLADAQAHYADAVKAILPTRVDVKYENFVSDRRIRLTQQRAEIADGKKKGKFEGLAFPEGSPKITRLLGQSQVDEMIALEGRLAALAPVWPEAAAEATEIAQHHQAYQAAIHGRTKAGQDASALRAIRNVAKQGWITTYVKSQHLVEAEFPQDTTMQDLFFDEIRTKSAAAQADDEEQNPADPAPATTPATPATP